MARGAIVFVREHFKPGFVYRIAVFFLFEKDGHMSDVVRCTSRRLHEEPEITEHRFGLFVSPCEASLPALTLSNSMPHITTREPLSITQRTPDPNSVQVNCWIRNRLRFSEILPGRPREPNGRR